MLKVKKPVFSWDSSGEIQANKKPVSKSEVSLQPLETQMVFWVVVCWSLNLDLHTAKSELRLWHSWLFFFFSVLLEGLITISFVGKGEFSCVTCSMIVCCLLQCIRIIGTECWVCTCACCHLAFFLQWLFLWLLIFLERVTDLCVQHDWRKGCCLLHLTLAV